MHDRTNILLSILSIVLLVSIGVVVVTKKQYFGFSTHKVASQNHQSITTNTNTNTTTDNTTNGGAISTSVDIQNPTTETEISVDVVKQ